jgi:ATP-dependent Clp protease adaptor protein ClpS
VPPPTTIVEADVQTTSATKLAPRWRVVLWNDDVTTFQFVIELLRSLFRKPQPEAVRLTHEIHNRGSAAVEVTSRERAELYVDQVKSLARPRGFPLTATIEPE